MNEGRGGCDCDHCRGLLPHPLLARYDEDDAMRSAREGAVAHLAAMTPDERCATFARAIAPADAPFEMAPANAEFAVCACGRATDGAVCWDCLGTDDASGNLARERSERVRDVGEVPTWREELERFGVRFVGDDEVTGIHWLPAPKGQPVAGSLREALEARAAELRASAREQIVDYLRGEPGIAANVDVEGIVTDIRALGVPA